MEDSQQFMVNRRNVLKAAGGAAAAGALGSPLAGTALADHDQDDTAVRVNQVGYPTGERKEAIVTSDKIDLSSVSSFEVVDADTGSMVEDGDLEFSAEGNETDEFGTDHDVKFADFSDLDDEGEYKVVVGDHESRPFEIADAGELYAPLLRDVGRLYTLKRANADIDDAGNTNLDIGPGHPQDAEAIVAEPDTDNYDDFLADEDVSPGDTIDVSFGWYDAGDYGKYVVPGALSVAQMILAYERNPDAFHEGQFHVSDVVDDEWGEGLPDILVEAKYELKFLQAMQRSSGGLFYKLAAPEWPAMSDAPSEDTTDRYVYGNSSVGTAHACGAFAMAARVYDDAGDEQFASEMRDCAEKAWDWLTADENEGLVWDESQVEWNGEVLSQDSGSGRYGRGVAPNGEEDDANYDEPARYWAAAELLRTTGDLSEYDQYIQDTDLTWESFDGTAELPGDVEAPIDWNNVAGLGNWAYYHTDGEDAGSGTDEEGSAAAGLTSPFWVGERYTGEADTYDAYRTGVYDFYWGVLKSGVSRGFQGLWAKEVYEESVSYEHWYRESEFSDMIKGPLHHVLGRSATGYSYVTGYGERSTEHPHDRIINSQDMDEPIPGMLVGGPHNNVFPPDIGEDEGDVTSEHVDEGVSHGMSYYDHLESYATNEWAINYTAPLFLMLAEVVDSIDSTPEPEYDIGGGNTQPPGMPPNLEASNVSADSIDVSWGESSGEVHSYHVFINDEWVEQTSTLSYTISDSSNIESGSNIIEVHAENSGGTSDKASITVTVGDGGGCEDAADTETLDNGQMVCDVDGDGNYRDVNADGSVSNGDITDFFGNQHVDPWDSRTDLFDFDGNNDVGQGDVVELFHYVN